MTPRDTHTRPGVVCSQVLVDKFSAVHKTCDGYCKANGLTCEDAWEEKDNDCSVAKDLKCDETIDSSDAICECKPKDDATKGACHPL